jgi:excisionase family DNA binding protein
MMSRLSGIRFVTDIAAEPPIQMLAELCHEARSGFRRVPYEHAQYSVSKIKRVKKDLVFLIDISRTGTLNVYLLFIVYRYLLIVILMVVRSCDAERRRNGKADAMVPVAARFEQFLTIKDVAYLLSVHPMTVYRLLKQGRLPGVRLGGVWRFSRQAIERWESDQERRTLRNFSNYRGYPRSDRSAK